MGPIVRAMLGWLLAIAWTGAHAALLQDQITHFSSVDDKIRALQARYRPEEVLLVFDVDSTLLTSEQVGDLGSDAWIGWQFELLDRHPDHEALVAHDPLGLHRVENMITRWMELKPVEQDQARRVQQWQEAGFRTMVLTARSPDVRDVTERELWRNGYHFEDPNDPLLRGVPGVIQLAQLDKEVSFMDGVAMANFNHKGNVLKGLLHHTTPIPLIKAIVFVDDSPHNVRHMVEAFSHQPVIGYALQYTFLEADKQAFLRSCDTCKGKAKAKKDFEMLQSTWSQVFHRKPIVGRERGMDNDPP